MTLRTETTTPTAPNPQRPSPTARLPHFYRPNQIPLEKQGAQREVKQVNAALIRRTDLAQTPSNMPETPPAFEIMRANADTLDPIFARLGLDSSTVHSFSQNPEQAFAQITKISQVFQLIYQQLLILEKDQPMSFFANMASNCRELGNITAAIQSPQVDYRSVQAMIDQLSPVAGITDYAVYYQLQQLTESNLLQDQRTIQIRLGQLAKAANITIEQMFASFNQVVVDLAVSAAAKDKQKFLDRFHQLEPEFATFLNQFDPTKIAQLLRAYLAGDVLPITLRIPHYERPSQLCRAMVSSISIILIIGILSTSCAPLQPSAAEPQFTPTTAATLSPPKTPTATSPPLAIETATPEISEQQRKDLNIVSETINVLNLDWTQTQPSTGVTYNLSLDEAIYGGQVMLYATKSSPPESGMGPNQRKVFALGMVNLEQLTLTNPTVGRVPLQNLVVTPDGLTILQVPATGDPAPEPVTYVFNLEAMSWQEKEAERFFETQPFNSVDEVEAVLGAENYTRAMEVQIPDGPKLIVLVDDKESPYRIRQIDYMPDGPDGQPANEELAQILLAQMLSVQQQANTISADGRHAASTAPKPGEEELSVVDFALARDDHDPEQVLAPELARVNLPVNSSRIETVIFASVKNQTQDKENAYVELGDGTRLKLHIHAGATNEHSYVGLGLAELPDGGLVLICFISTSGSPQDKDPLLSALAPLNTGWVTVEMGALHPDYITDHYEVIGGTSNPPVTTQVIDQIKPANRASYLKYMAPKVVGQR